MKKKIVEVVFLMLVITTLVPAVTSLKNNQINTTVPINCLESIAESWGQQQKLLAADGAAYDVFGMPVSLSGDTVLIGANQDGDNGHWSGSAYVFIRAGATWTQQAKLVPSDGAEYDQFGWSASLDGDTALIGSFWDSDNGIHSGSAYVFTRTGTIWTQQAKLLPSDGAANDEFGWVVALDGDTALIGAPLDDDNGVDSGSAYVFTRTGTTWTQQAKLLASDGAAGDGFSADVSLYGDTALIGAPLDDDNGDDSGSQYVFTRTGTTWTQQAKLLPLDGAAGDWFGGLSSIDGDTALIGAQLDDDNGDDSGSAYVFTRTGTIWTQQAKLLPSDGAAYDEFGWWVALDGDTALIGAPLDDDNGVDSGSAYVFTRTGTTWTQQAKLLASDGDAGNSFGYCVSLYGETAFIGAPKDDDNGAVSGSAYAFVKDQLPSKPVKPSGETSGKLGVEYNYTTNTIDPDGDQVYYNWSWGDGKFSGWLGPYDSGLNVSGKHIWNKKGTYQIKVKAKDVYGVESDWSDPLLVTMPKNKAIDRPFFNFLQNFIQSHPNLLPILQKLLQR